MQTHEDLEAMTGKGTKYEVVELSTGEAYPVTEVIFGGDEITMKIDTEKYGGAVTFDNRKGDGIFATEHFVAREIGTHNAGDGHTKVEVAPEVTATEAPAEAETVTTTEEVTAPVAETTEEEVKVA